MQATVALVHLLFHVICSEFALAPIFAHDHSRETKLTSSTYFYICPARLAFHSGPFGARASGLTCSAPARKCLAWCEGTPVVERPNLEYLIDSAWNTSALCVWSCLLSPKSCRVATPSVSSVSRRQPPQVRSRVQNVAKSTEFLPAG